MTQPDKKTITPTLHDIEKAVNIGASKRRIYGELSQLASIARNDGGVVAEIVTEKLKEIAVEIGRK